MNFFLFLGTATNYWRSKIVSMWYNFVYQRQTETVTPFVRQTSCYLKFKNCIKLKNYFFRICQLIIVIFVFSFIINLQKNKAIYPHPVIAFHLNPRFHYGNVPTCVVMNYWINGSWGNEERHEGHLSWMPGREFLLT